MRLQKVKIQKLYGTLDLEIDFNNEITLLVGINGSGKTSILNVIDWLLRPNLRLLVLTEFIELCLGFGYDGNDYELNANKSNGRLTISIKSEAVEVAPITVNLVHDGNLADSGYAEEMYSRLGLEKHEVPLWELLQSFPKPTVITLDRTISAEADGKTFYESSRSRANANTRAVSPLAQVLDVTSARYSKYRAKSTENDAELKARILMSALQAPTAAITQATLKPMTMAEIERLEGKVINYLSGSIKTEEVTKQVRRFFSSSKTMTAPGLPASKEQDLVLSIVNSQYKQIENLAKAFNDFDLKNAAAFSDLKNYLVAVNKFFEDSSKELYFDDSTGRLVFSFLDKKNSRTAERRLITHLSSGEKQILILFTFLAFVAKEGSVFIVDEPELSLHPKWQHEFMEFFLKLKPNDTQLLLATHSPDIVGKFKRSCIPLVRQ